VADKASLEVGWSRTAALLAGNGALLLVTILALGRHARSLRRRLEARVARAAGS
jgi:hypothetical protein